MSLLQSPGHIRVSFSVRPCCSGLDKVLETKQEPASPATKYSLETGDRIKMVKAKNSWIEIKTIQEGNQNMDAGRAKQGVNLLLLMGRQVFRKAGLHHV